MADNTTIAEVIAMLRRLGCRPPEAWQGSKPSEIVELWAAILADVPDDDLRRAAVSWARGASCAFFPLPGQLLAQIGAAEKPVTEADRKAAGDAVWAQVQRAYHGSGGMYADPERFTASLPEVTRNALEAVGGWPKLRAAMCAADDGFSMGELGRAIARQVALRPEAATPAGVQALIEGATRRGGLVVLRGGRA